MSAYPNFGKVKTIVLPAPLEGGMTLDEYREKFGIDLREFVYLKDDNIYFEAPNSLVLINVKSTFNAGIYQTDILAPVTNSAVQAYDSGTAHDGFLTIGGYTSEEESPYGITFIIPHTDEFKIENLKVSYKGF